MTSRTSRERFPGILGAVEIGEAHGCLSSSTTPSPGGRRVDLLARQIDMGVVEVQRDVGEHAHAERGDDDAAA